MGRVLTFVSPTFASLFRNPIISRPRISVVCNDNTIGGTVNRQTDAEPVLRKARDAARLTNAHASGLLGSRKSGSRDQNNMRDTSREGLAWDDNGLGPEPQWTREPEIQAVRRVCRRHLGVANDGSDGDFAVSFLADGAFNKLYHVKTARGQFVMRVSLPVDPRNKTRGEAATLQLVHRKTDIPVPAVVAFDDSRASEIGFEWLLMDMIPGTPVYYRWRKMSMAQKETLTARVADFQAQLLRCGNFGNGFRSIGTLGAGPELDRGGLPEPGQIVSAFFFLGERWHYAVPRGPFQSSHDWYVHCLGTYRRQACD